MFLEGRRLLNRLWSAAALHGDRGVPCLRAEVVNAGALLG